jgi:hypothetical protein
MLLLPDFRANQCSQKRKTPSERHTATLKQSARLKRIQMGLSYTCHGWRPAARVCVAEQNTSAGPMRRRWVVMPQLRQFTRFKLRFPVVFVWKDEGGQHEGQGITSNISVAGMFIQSSVCPPVGSSIRCEIFLASANQENNIAALEGDATGSVVRTHTDEESGFAVSSSEFVVRQRD